MASGTRPPVNLDVDFANPESWVRGMPERMRWLRENTPVYWSERSQLWLLSRFAEVSQVSTDQESFTSGDGVRPGSSARLGLLEQTGPRHAQLRAVLSRGFTPQIIQRLEGVFRPQARAVIQRALAQRQVEFVREVASPLSQALIGDMIGLSDEDHAQLAASSDDLMSRLDAGVGLGMPPDDDDGLGEIRLALHEALQDRRVQPRGDMLSVLVGSTRAEALSSVALPFLDEPGAEDPSTSDARTNEIEDDDLVSLLATLFVIGTRTSRSALSGTMQLLIENAAERRMLGRHPDRIPGAVEEIMRLVSPVQSFARTVVSGLELGGERLERGDRVLMLYGSANRDPAVFDDPDRFRIDRHPRHLGFGIGPHFCLGANLARMAARVFIETLVEQVGEVAWGVEGEAFELAPSCQIRDYARMTVEFSPAGSPPDEPGGLAST